MVVACGSTGLPAPAETPSPISTGQPPQAEIEIQVTGGPAEGSYRAVVHGRSCSRPTESEFLVSYTDPAAVDGFTALGLDLRDAESAIDDETDNFALDVTVAGTSYAIDPSVGNGAGVVLLEIDPLANVTLDLSATAPDGAIIDLSVLCDLV